MLLLLFLLFYLKINLTIQVSLLKFEWQLVQKDALKKRQNKKKHHQHQRMSTGYSIAAAQYSSEFICTVLQPQKRANCIRTICTAGFLGFRNSLDIYNHDITRAENSVCLLKGIRINPVQSLLFDSKQFYTNIVINLRKTLKFRQ